jgi:hypothetical protein
MKRVAEKGGEFVCGGEEALGGSRGEQVGGGGQGQGIQTAIWRFWMHFGSEL